MRAMFGGRNLVDSNMKRFLSGLFAATAAAPVWAAGVEPASIYDFTMNDINGKPVKLSAYKGKVILVVNVASKCGLTPQYTALEALYKQKHKEGFVILGFPANNFMGQEPGTNEEIKTFCSTKYDVTFPLFSKISVKGNDQAELYKWLIHKSDNQGDIEWNFAKFLISRDGQVVARFKPQVVPTDAKLVQAIDQALAAKH